MIRPVSFFESVDRQLGAYRWASSLIVALVLSVTLAVVVLVSRISSDQKMFAAISPYLATLVESQDRPELLRLFQSIAQGRGTQVLLVQHGLVFASSRNLSELDRPLELPRTWMSLHGIQMTGGNITLRMPIVHTSNADTLGEIISLTPVSPILEVAGIAALLALAMLLLLSYLSALRMKSAIRKALAPLDRLHQEIVDLGQGNANRLEMGTPLAVLELEEIRQTLRTALQALAAARDELARAHAKKLSAEAYKRMIHDLHTPVAALRQNVRIIDDIESDHAAKVEAADSLPRIADQILKQITAAKRNLDDQPQTMTQADVRSCVIGSVRQVIASQGRPMLKPIEIDCPESPVIAAHDADLLQRAIVNLVENGVQAAQSLVRVTVLPSTSVSGPAIVVSDDGLGMEETSVALHLQGRGQSTKEDRQAFGLSSANHIVRTHGGRIIYRKSPDLGGACFEVRLGAL